MKKFRTFTEQCEFMLREGNKAIRKAQTENLRKGIPNVYVIGGQHVYQMPDGKITTTSPFKKGE